jgi:hypothetical protein
MIDGTLRAGQSIQATDAAVAVSRVAARFATGGDELARLVREMQDLAEWSSALDRAVVEAVSRPPDQRDHEREETMRRERAAVTSSLDVLVQSLAERFPEYDELVSRESTNVEDLQGLLAPSEALLAYVELSEDKEAREPEATILWLIRPDRAEMFRLDLAPGELDAAVRKLRDQLDPGRWSSEHRPRSTPPSPTISTASSSPSTPPSSPA